MFHCESCSLDVDNKDVNDTDFEFSRTKGGNYKIIYAQKCRVCGGELAAGFSKREFVNICSEGDFKQHFSIEMGVMITSPQQRDRELKKRGMVVNSEAKEFRDSQKETMERASAGEFNNRTDSNS
jgi:hypothetical protein